MGPPPRNGEVAEAAVDRVLLIAGIGALGALFAATILLDRTVGGRLPLALHLVIVGWIVLYAATIPFVSRARSMRELNRLRAVNLGAGVLGALAACYLLGGAAWVGPYVLFFAVLGAAFVQMRSMALIYGAVIIGGFGLISGAEAAGWLPSHDPFRTGEIARADSGVEFTTIAFLSFTLLAFYGIAALIGVFVTLQRDLLKKASSELELKKDELQALNNDLEVRVAEKTCELEERNRELGVMAEIGKAVTASLDAEAIYMEFLSAARKVLPFDLATVAVLTPEGSEVRFLRARAGIDGVLERNAEIVTEPAAGSMHVSAKMRIVDDFTGIPDVPKSSPVHSLGLRSGAQVPIVANGTLLGGFTVGSTRPHRFVGQHISLMEQMAEQLALAIDNCRLYDEMREMAETDGLTRLPNRRAIARRIREEIARSKRSGELCSVLVLDIDNFKVFNDTLGHQAGDDLLVKFAQLLNEVCRESDVVARQAGDEFTILLPGSGPREATAVAQRIHDSLAATDLRYPGQDGVVVRTSVGVACYPMDSEDDDGLLIAADRAMYAAKAAGGGQSRIASRLTERETNADPSRQLRFGMLETLANRLAARDERRSDDLHMFANATAQAAWLIGERLALDDAAQQTLRVAALSHAIGVLPDDDPRSANRALGLDDDLDSLYLKIGRVFVAGSPGLNDAVRVIDRHHRPLSSLNGDPRDTFARILAVSERYAELTIGTAPHSPDDAIAQMQTDDALDQDSVQALDEALHAPAVWRAA